MLEGKLLMVKKKSLQYHYALLTWVSYCLASAGCYAEQAGKRQAANQSGNIATKEEKKSDACALITQADVEATMKSSMRQAAHDSTPAGDSRCRYISAEGPPWRVVEIEVETAKGALDNLKQMIEEATKGKDVPREIAGVGDGAVWISGAGFAAKTLMVMKKNVCAIGISLTGIDEQPALDAAKELATKAVERQ
jgi:hypothetical protein